MFSRRRCSADTRVVYDVTAEECVAVGVELTSARDLRDSASDARSRCTLPPIPLYGLRHSAASFALANGVGMKVVSEMLGHSSVAVTMSVYQAVTPGMTRAAVEQYAAALDGTGLGDE